MTDRIELQELEEEALDLVSGGDGICIDPNGGKTP
jgi:hypothetical protein